jgi:ketosteroid isomerase-like protein
MRSHVFAVALALAFAAGTQACFADATAATEPIEKLFSAFNADDGPRVNQAYAPNAAIVDEFAPFVWHGPAAGTSFWTSFLAFRKGIGLSDIHATHGPLAFLSYDDSKNTAYVVAPTIITCRLAGKFEKETGRWVFVVKKIGGAWLIQNSSWATTSYSNG